ncbi:MAG: hypothetical protein KGL67_02910 [Patescibacteria group bacterium]|nr:hypothetical protein [Patescibacteria group bacterium]
MKNSSIVILVLAIVWLGPVGLTIIHFAYKMVKKDWLDGKLTWKIMFFVFTVSLYTTVAIHLFVNFLLVPIVRFIK